MGDHSGIKIIKADLDEDSRGMIVTGYLAPESLGLLKVDDYQREELSESKILALMDAQRNGRVPTVELGMRGDESAIDIADDTVYFLTAPVYIVDGLQRITAARRLLTTEPGVNPKIQVTVHLNTDHAWERKRFEVLNVGQTKVNGNVILRNLRHEVDVVEVLYRLSSSRSFVLCARVAWQQNKKRGELISGLTLAQTVGMLHSHIGPGRSSGGPEIARGLQKIMENVGRGNLQANTRLFFDVVNGCWGIESVAFRDTAVQLKQGFLLSLAKLFSDHTNFWQAAKLVVDRPTLLKLGTFPMRDPSVIALAGNAGKSVDMLTYMLAEHINKGRRTNKLVRRNGGDVPQEETENGEGE